MGLIKAALGAAGGVLGDQWKEYFYCDAIPADILAVKGRKRVSGRSSNTNGVDNIISSGSIIAVAEGQCMIIVEQGKIVEVCAEPGEFTYDASTEPTIFAGGLSGENIKKVFATLGKRFTFGGEAPKDQRVYYFNTKEIVDNKYGTANPIPFRVIVDERLGYRLSVDLRCNGVYSYRITNPLLFFANVCGNISSAYSRSGIDSMLKGELLSALQPALAKIAAKKVMYYEIPAYTTEIAAALNEELSSQWRDRRGIEVCSITVNSVTIPDDQRKKITEWEETAMSTDINTAAARRLGMEGEAMKMAASNSAGAMTGFMGMGMAMNAGGVSSQNLYAMAQQQAPVQAAQAAPAAAADSWKCSCGAVATGKFCPECGAKKPEVNGWTCTQCGTVNTGKFCVECGAKKPAGVPQYKCDKCGWVPADPKNPPKFCPECGDPFGDEDIV